MEFSAFIQRLSGNVILLFNDSPIKNVKSVRSYQEISNGAFKKKEFRWSVDRSSWSAWVILNQSNIELVQPLEGQSSVYFEFKYVRHSPNQGTIQKMVINYDALTDDCLGTPLPIPPVPACDPNSGGPINASLLNGKPGSYYLLRQNHQGTQSIKTIEGLNKILINLSNGVQNSITDAFNVDGSGIGVFYKEIDNAIYFKRIISANEDITITENNGIITLDFDASLASKDPSTDELYQIVEDLSINVTDLSIYIDQQFFNVDVCINDIWSYLNNLDVSIGGVNLPEGTTKEGEIYKDSSGNILRFRSIRGLGDVSVNTNGDYVDIFIDVSVSGGPLWTDTDSVTADVGGISGGDIVSLGLNPIEVLEDILYEYFPPTVESSVFFGATEINDPQYYEKWIDTPGPYDISVYFTSKSKVVVQNGYIQKNGSTIDSSLFDSSIGYLNTSTTSPTWIDAHLSVKLENEFKTITMADYDVSIQDINFVNPTYYGVVPNSIDASTITQLNIEQYCQKVYDSSMLAPKQDNDLIFDSSGITMLKFVYAYDSSYGPLSKIFDIQNDFNVTTSFDSSIIDFTSIGASPSDIPYRVYIKSHWIDVSTFRLIFNI